MSSVSPTQHCVWSSPVDPIQRQDSWNGLRKRIELHWRGDSHHPRDTSWDKEERKAEEPSPYQPSPSSTEPSAGISPAPHPDLIRALLLLTSLKFNQFLPSRAQFRSNVPDDNSFNHKRTFWSLTPVAEASPHILLCIFFFFCSLLCFSFSFREKRKPPLCQSDRMVRPMRGNARVLSPLCQEAV